MHPRKSTIGSGKDALKERPSRRGFTIPRNVLARADRGHQVRRGECQVSRVEWIEIKKDMKKKTLFLPFAPFFLALCLAAGREKLDLVQLLG
jgi:hypothetical protein